MIKSIYKILFPTLLILFLLTLVACSDSEGDSRDNSTQGDSEKEVELTLWLWPGTGFDELAKIYEEENNVKINVQVSAHEDVYTNITTALGAGSGAPDIVAMQSSMVSKMLKTPDFLHNMNDYGGEEIRDDYLDWRIELAETKDGALLGLPTDIGPMAFAYNLEIFEEAGLPTDREEVAALIQTWEDYREVAAIIKEKTGKPMINDPFGVYVTRSGQSETVYYDSDGNIIAGDNPLIKEAYDYTIELIESGYTSNVPIFSPEWLTGSVNDDFATQMAPAYVSTIMQANAPDAAGKWDLFPIPEGASNYGGSFFVIPSQSEHPEEAFEFLSWLLAAEQQLTIFKEYGNFPTTPGAYEEIKNETSDYFNGAPAGKIYTNAANEIPRQYTGPDATDISEVINDALKRVNDGQMEAEESWNSALDQIERQYGN